MDKIGRMRALEKDLREEERQQLAESRRHADEGNDETVQAFCNGKAFGLNSAAQRIATLIAELGQEVGAVDPVEADNAKAADCAALAMIGKGYYWNGDAWVLSPAHTSEARDALDISDVRIVIDFIFRQFGRHWNVGPALTDDVVAAVRRVEAAMRQEGGTP